MTSHLLLDGRCRRCGTSDAEASAGMPCFRAEARAGMPRGDAEVIAGLPAWRKVLPRVDRSRVPWLVEAFEPVAGEDVPASFEEAASAAPAFYSGPAPSFAPIAAADVDRSAIATGGYLVTRDFEALLLREPSDSLLRQFFAGSHIEVLPEMGGEIGFGEPELEDQPTGRAEDRLMQAIRECASA